MLKLSHNYKKFITGIIALLVLLLIVIIALSLNKPNSWQYAFVQNGNIFVVSADAKKQLTFDGSANVAYKALSFVDQGQLLYVKCEAAKCSGVKEQIGNESKETLFDQTDPDLPNIENRRYFSWDSANNYLVYLTDSSVKKVSSAGISTIKQWTTDQTISPVGGCNSVDIINSQIVFCKTKGNLDGIAGIYGDLYGYSNDQEVFAIKKDDCNCRISDFTVVQSNLYLLKSEATQIISMLNPSTKVMTNVPFSLDYSKIGYISALKKSADEKYLIVIGSSANAYIDVSTNSIYMSKPNDVNLDVIQLEEELGGSLVFSGYY